MCIISITITAVDTVLIVSSFTSAEKNTDFMSEDRHLNFKQKHK